MTAQVRCVVLNKGEVQTLKQLARKGVEKAQVITRARVLLLADRNGAAKTDGEICEALDLSPNTPYRIRRRYCQGGLKKALYDAPRPGAPKTITLKDKATVTAIACSDPAPGYERWTLNLIKKESEKRQGKKIGRSTIHVILSQNQVKPWREKKVAHW